MKNKFLLIGLDGEATKISGWIANYNPTEKFFTLSSKYHEIKSREHELELLDCSFWKNKIKNIL